VNDDEREILWAGDEDEETEEPAEGDAEEEEDEDEEAEDEAEDEDDDDEDEDDDEDDDEEEDEDDDEEEDEEDEDDEEEDDEDEDDEDDEEEEGPVAVDADVFGSAEDFENAEEADFVADDGAWTSEDYQASAERLFGDSEHFGETVEEQLAEEGYTPADDEELTATLINIFPAASTTVNFFMKDDRVCPVGFVPAEYIAQIREEFPDADLSYLRTTVTKRVKPVKPGKLPAVLAKVDPKDTVDLRKYCSPIGDQGQTSRCSAFAWTHALEMANNMAGSDDARLSPTYTMLQFQKMQGDASDYEYAFKGGEGTVGGVRPGQVLVENGTCAQELWPDTEEAPAKKDAALAADAKSHKLGATLVPVKMSDVRKVLSAGCPVQLAMSTGEAFSTLGRDGIFKDAEAPKGQHGFHAMLIVGYVGNFFIVKNSWGTSWGDQGYCYIPKKVLTSSSPEFIAIMVGKGGGTDKAPGKGKKSKAN
jgi:hypothetical protein